MRSFLKNIKMAIAPGCIIGLMLSLGYVIKNEHGIVFSLTYVGLVTLSVICAVFVTAFVYFIIDKSQSVGENDGKKPLPCRMVKSSFLYYFICFAALLIIWFPSLLALYPGLYTYDAPWQYWMYCDGLVSEQQPVIHTYIMSIILDGMYELTGEFNKGVLVCSLLQMILMSAGCAYVFYVFHKEKVRTVFHVIAFVFWGLYTPFVIFVFTLTKDSIFAVAVADLAVINYEFFREGRRFLDKVGNLILLTVFALAVLMLRSNAVYAMIVFVPFLAAGVIKSICKKGDKGEKGKGRGNAKYVIKAIIPFFVTALLFAVYKYPVCNALTSQDTPKCETLSVPTQQLARVYNYHYDELDEEEIKSIENFFEDPELLSSYQPQIADVVKGNLNEEYYLAHKEAFYRLWIRIGCRYPGEYIDSFLENTYAFWYPMPKYVIYSNGDVSYTNMTGTYPVEQNPKLKGLFNYYMQFEKGSIVCGNNFTAALFSPAVFLYIFILVFFYGIYKKNRSTLILVFPLLLWMTFLLGPVAQVRYIVFMMALFPAMFLFLRKK